ncbi:arf-GAP domain and FG repeat-containing protein 2 isoform X2 [Sphaerodactylus townsendi]|uniref:arf-GAP domain and FG repeat-containing protein 2 isoform X2 n=1 Tax=Sphaerodactylus townsendi TaxID=933632 RepID=UPI002026E184|nr:arf-GAP domain and FG repeat-containing protein 2 isoform X2 [Sphaerodactylus townsendi]
MAAAGSGARKPGSPRDSEAEVWSRRVRELVGAEPANRLCFECGQRGVTYVDITLGSFVCTGCSGALRGLNPPHRVKSISMTTFTESEVQFLRSRGNQACRKIWLGSFDSRTSLLPDSQDPQKLKEFLQEKYEKKRWYVTPEPGKSLSSLAAQSSTSEAKTLLGDSGPVAAAIKPAQSADRPHPQGLQPAKKASMDLLADIGGDPFAAPHSGPAFPAFPAFGGQVPARATFAPFDAFGGSPAAFGDPLTSSQSPFQGHHMAAGGTHMGGFPVSPASQPGVSIPEMGGTFRVGGVPSSAFGALSQSPLLPPPSPAAAYGACTNPFATSAISQPTLPSTNPFQTNGLAPGAFMVGSPSSFSASPLSGIFASPLQQQQQHFHPQALVGEQQSGGSPFGGFPIAKAGQRPLGQPASISTNPFVTPMTTAPPIPFVLGKHPPTNPFL